MSSKKPRFTASTARGETHSSSSSSQQQNASQVTTPLPTSYQTLMSQQREIEFRWLNKSFDEFLVEDKARREQPAAGNSVTACVNNATQLRRGGRTEETALLEQTANEYVRFADQIELLYDCFTLYRGTVMGMGSNESSQLTTVDAPTDATGLNSNLAPHLVKALQYDDMHMRMVSAGGIHSVTLSTNGTPYTWGASDTGALGRLIMNDLDEGRPTPITGFISTVLGQSKTKCDDGQIIQIAAGESHTLFLSFDGTVYQCGSYNNKDNTPFSDDDSRSVHTDIQKKGVCGKNQKPVHVYQLPGKATTIYAGHNYSVALLDDGTILTWGMGTCGELARSAGMTRPDTDGDYQLDTLYLRDATEPDGKPEIDASVVQEHYLKPKPVKFAHQPRIQPMVIAVACGASHLVAVARDPQSKYPSHGKLYTSGLNNYGQLGHGDKDVNRHALTLVEAVKHVNFGAVEAGAHFSLALTHDRAVLFSFGRADYGQLGIGLGGGVDIAGSSKLTPQIVRFPKKVVIKSISAGDKNAYALTVDDEVYSWGYNEEGQTGHPLTMGGNLLDVYIPTLLNLNVTENVDGSTSRKRCRPVQISGGGQHTLMLVRPLLEK